MFRGDLHHELGLLPPAGGSWSVSFQGPPSSLRLGLSPSGGHTEDRHSSSVSLLLYPPDADLAAPLGRYQGSLGGSDRYQGSLRDSGLYQGSLGGLGLYKGSLGGHDLSPRFLPYLRPFRLYECPFEPAFIQKRNERERQRVKCVNRGYTHLRDHLPGHSATKRLSKVQTLRAAIRYIKYLESLMELQEQKEEQEGEEVSREERR